jgi:alkaline phosphatase D
MKDTLLLFAFCIFAQISFSQLLFHPELEAYYTPALQPFYFGVASGDPQPHSVVIWTKVVPEDTGPQRILWEVATDTLLQNVVQSGTGEADSSSAFTLKLLVENLDAGTRYYYRFQHEGKYSPIGRTKTAPGGEVKLLRFAVVSCANFPSGYFNAFGDIARRNDLDAVLHLGDYIYEYGGSGPRKKKKNFSRPHIPNKEILTLKDYRTRYGQYRLDPQLMEAHRLHPFIVIWDDHESANNSNVSGAQNHDPGREGDWEKRKAIARQVYFEWLPVRDNPRRSIIRSFKYGDLAELWMLDGRLEGRSPQARGIDDPELPSPERHMLGEHQTQWLLDGMKNSTARWKIMGNQVIFSPLNDSKVFSRNPTIRMDRWDGYPAERDEIFDFFYKNNMRNIIVVTGDVHTSWAFELTGDPLDPSKYNRKTGLGVIGAEFVTPSVSAFNFDEVVPKFVTWEAKRRFCKKKNNPHLRFLNLNRHGYMTLTLTPERAQADWFFVKTLYKVDDRYKQKGRRYIEFDGNQVKKKKSRR